jgi:hypothetical protein
MPSVRGCTKLSHGSTASISSFRTASLVAQLHRAVALRCPDASPATATRRVWTGPCAEGCERGASGEAANETHVPMSQLAAQHPDALMLRGSEETILRAWPSRNTSCSGFSVPEAATRRRSAEVTVTGSVTESGSLVTFATTIGLQRAQSRCRCGRGRQG